MPTLYLTGIRFTLAGAILLGIALHGQPLPRRASQWGHEALTGILLVPLANGSVVWAEHYIASGLAALLAATLPLWMALLERLLIRSERLTPSRIAGLIVGFCGVAAVVAPAIAKPSTGGALILGTMAMQFYALSWNLGTLRAKYQPSGVPPALAPALQMLLGGLVTLIAAAIVGPWQWSYLTMRSGLSLLYLTLFGSVIAFSAYFYALRVIPPGKLTLFAYMQPVVAAIAGTLVLHEPITIPMLVGMLLILGGVTVARRGR
ncbi:MAG TPA: EamA family transporter [Thermoanaerobaculia bacterium]|nr:EamA family transporter [Thermoanaerobaculia bacterium]